MAKNLAPSSRKWRKKNQIGENGGERKINPSANPAYNQDLVSVVVAHCISYAPKVCSHCSRCCCCLLLYDRQRMGIRLNSARGPGLCHRSWPLSFLHLPSIPSSPWLLSISRASWHIPLASRPKIDTCMPHLFSWIFFSKNSLLVTGETKCSLNSKEKLVRTIYPSPIMWKSTIWF